MDKKIFILLSFSLLLGACNSTTSNKDNTLSLTSEKQAVLGQQTTNQPVQPKIIQQTPQPNTSNEPNIIITDEEIASMSAKIILKTTKGEISLKLYPEETPQTVKNFLTKIKSNYYNNLTFHRVEDWVVQGGDPLGNGTGGGQIPTELSKMAFKEGSLGVARGGDIRISNDSQFFICTKDCGWLTGQYTNFGEVLEGMDIVKSIEIGDKIISLQISKDAKDN